MKRYTFDSFTITNDKETIVTDKQLWISVFNTIVPNVFKEIALKEINNYITTHQELTFNKSDELICILQIYMTNTKPLDEKFSILIFLYNEKKDCEKDCVINVPIFPNKGYFKDFKELVMVELEEMIF